MTTKSNRKLVERVMNRPFVVDTKIRIPSVVRQLHKLFSRKLVIKVCVGMFDVTIEHARVVEMEAIRRADEQL